VVIPAAVLAAVVDFAVDIVAAVAGQPNTVGEPKMVAPTRTIDGAVDAAIWEIPDVDMPRAGMGESATGIWVGRGMITADAFGPRWQSETGERPTEEGDSDANI